MSFPEKMTFGEKYGPAMKITNEAEAQVYFDLCVEHCMRFGKSRDEAESIERQNLGYYAGYHDTETRLRVERLFSCSHPIFGKAEKGIPTIKAAFNAGKAFAEAPNAQ